jgi:hypothetical protein
MYKRATTQAELMELAPKAISHLRAQRDRRRLGLIFGSGACKDLGFPDWAQLVEQIANHTGVDAVDLLKKFSVEHANPADQSKPIRKSLASITQMLFGHYRMKEIAKLGLSESLHFLDEQKIRTSWLKIIHQELYKKINHDDRKRLIEAHPYLMSFLEIIRNSPLTVNYNFDDTLEQLLFQNRTGEEATRTRGFEVTYRPNAQFQNDKGIIYHPNGYVPFVFSDGTSPEVVFSDDAFQDQLISAATGRYIHLSNHLFRNTCLLIGLSLEDATLQSLLRQNAVTNSGHIHYIAHFLEPDEKDDPVAMEAIFQSNFSSYNLYTIFVDNAGIKELATLLSLSPDQFHHQFARFRRKFVYYVIGPVGAGKSTATGNFRSLITYDEWIDERKPALALPESEISKDDKAQIDPWLVEQFKKKNYAVMKNDEGIHLIDRCPLDPLTFSDPSERSVKAKNLVREIEELKPISPGHLILLDCEVSDLQVRNSFKHKYWPEEELNRLKSAIAEVYGSTTASTIWTCGRNASDVAREIAKVIFLHEYAEVDVRKELQQYAGE